MLESDLQKLSVTGLVTLYELDATKLGAGIMRWHGHVSFEDWQKVIAWAGREDQLIGNTDENVGREYWAGDGEIEVKRDLIWQGQIYNPIPIQSDGLEMRGDGRASTPSLVVANNLNGLQGAISALCLRHDDFAGAKLTVINTMAKYLDAANFAEGNPQAANEYRKQLWYVEQKTSENASAVTFELSNPVDFEGARIPSRDITSFCHWAVHGRYRGQECGYTGTAMFTEDGTPTDDPSKDKCSARLGDGCRIRFGDNVPLPYGGFPSSSLISG
ncbi:MULTISPECIES: phage minor tail protein L [unclassified Psychrobacter]|uniref:phage minor tail protein L n=1 Tax=unclassified Psychrobacter TaxID=196806 RepID=UPI0008689C9B|nr:phage minor tail protein L [Psychrobacter sp. B29-1]OEH68520.1 MAG: phage minor tail protein L [Psychrobacter sp. B29-1]